jgi:hypothetical protein
VRHIQNKSRSNPPRTTVTSRLHPDRAPFHAPTSPRQRPVPPRNQWTSGPIPIHGPFPPVHQKTRQTQHVEALCVVTQQPGPTNTQQSNSFPGTSRILRIRTAIREPFSPVHQNPGGPVTQNPDGDAPNKNSTPVNTAINKN